MIRLFIYSHYRRITGVVTTIVAFGLALLIGQLIVSVRL